MKPCKDSAKPCSECPYRKTSLPGWFGGNTKESYSDPIVFDIPTPCHKTMGSPEEDQVFCAGLAITRVNSCKSARNDEVIKASEEAAKDSPWRRECFSFKHQFDRHHGPEPE